MCKQQSFTRRFDSFYYDYVAESGQNSDLLDKVLKYNEGDYLVTVKILDWMIQEQTDSQDTT